MDQGSTADITRNPAKKNLADLLKAPVAVSVDDLVTTEAETPVAPAPAAYRKPVPAGFLSREQILIATDECFTEKGYDGTTIRAIAKRLGCAVGSIYRYYKNKHELLTAMAEAKFDGLFESLEADGITFDAAAGEFIDCVLTNSEAYRILFWLSAPETPRVVTRIIDAWSGPLGYGTVASQKWAHIHGLLMLGWSKDDILSTLGEEPKILTVVQQPAATPASEQSSQEDVTLL